jgi:hypothetical protein
MEGYAAYQIFLNVSELRSVFRIEAEKMILTPFCGKAALLKISFFLRSNVKRLIFALQLRLPAGQLSRADPVGMSGFRPD